MRPQAWLTRIVVPSELEAAKKGEGHENQALASVSKGLDEDKATATARRREKLARFCRARPLMIF